MATNPDGFRKQYLQEVPMPTMEDLLAQALRNVMEMTGRPQLHEYQRRDRKHWEEHARQWNEAKEILNRYDLSKL